MTILPGRRARILLLAGLSLATAPATAQSTLSTGPDCGGDAYSAGQVVENRPPRRGPLIAMPETLCADVAPQGPRGPAEIGIDPYRDGSGPPPRDGGRGLGDPYGERPPRFRRP